MLGQGRHHKHVPRELEANLAYRKKVLLWARESRKHREAIVAACRQDILYYINAFVWQINPRKKGFEVGPFITWEFQEKSLFDPPNVVGNKRTAGILWCIENDKDLLIQKSREMGATWWLLIVQDWVCRFHKHKNFIDMSHSEKAVDSSGDPNALFPKLTFINEHLPHWFPQAKKKKLALHYPMSHSNINGTSTTDRSSVGGRSTGLFLDEFSKHQDDYAILGNTADVGCRIFNGTHYGTGTAFYDLCNRPELIQQCWHWSQHPDKNKGLYEYVQSTGQVIIHDKSYVFPPNYQFVMTGEPTGGPYPGIRSPWYDEECVRRGSKRDVAMHLDIDPRGSVSQVFDPVMIQRLVSGCRQFIWEGDVAYDRDLGIPDRLIARPGGLLRLWVNPDGNGCPPDGLYVIGADISTGMGRTPSCLSIFNIATGERVGEYANARIGPKEFGILSVALAKMFKTPTGTGAKLIWETPGPGFVYGAAVVDVGYLNIYFRTHEHDLKHTVSNIPGWPATVQSKLTLIEDYRDGLQSRKFVNYSETALQECLSLRYAANGNIQHSNEASTNDPSGALTNHADRVIPDALCWRVAKERGANKKQIERETIAVGSLAWRRQMAYHKRHDEDAILIGELGMGSG